MDSVIFYAVAIVGAVATAISLLMLWPSIAGKLLFAGVLVLLLIPQLRTRLIEAATRHAATTGGAPPAANTFDQVLALALQVIIGGIIGLIFICAIEDYLAGCYWYLDVKLGERPPGQFCPAEPQILWTFNFLRGWKDPFGDYSGYIMTAIILVGLPAAVFWFRTPPAHIVQGLGGDLPDWIVRIATALVAVSWFSFWPVVDGSPTELSRVIAALREGGESEKQNNFFYATTKRQERLGRDLLKLLQSKELPPGEEERARATRELIQRIYMAIANTNAAAKDVKPEEGERLSERMRWDILRTPPREAPAPACSSRPGTVCPDQIDKLSGAYRYRDAERERASQRDAARAEFEQEVRFPLTVAVEEMLRTRNGDKNPEAIRLTARVVLVVVDTTESESAAAILQELQRRTNVAEEDDREGRSRAAYLRCFDLNRVLVQFLNSEAGRKMIETIVQNGRDEFIRRHPDAARSISARGNQVIQEALTYAAQQSSEGDLRSVVFGRLETRPTRYSAEEWPTEKQNIAQLIGNILRAACFDGLTEPQFTERLNSFAT